MKQEYIITEDILRSDYGLILSDYALDTTYVEMIIRIALGKAVTEILYLNDNFHYESDIEKALDDEPQLVGAFVKLQYQIIYNLIVSKFIEIFTIIIMHFISFISCFYK